MRCRKIIYKSIRKVGFIKKKQNKVNNEFVFRYDIVFNNQMDIIGMLLYN